MMGADASSYVLKTRRRLRYCFYVCLDEQPSQRESLANPSPKSEASSPHKTLQSKSMSARGGAEAA